jgi:hypothetical protein
VTHQPAFLVLVIDCAICLLAFAATRSGSLVNTLKQTKLSVRGQYILLTIAASRNLPSSYRQQQLQMVLRQQTVKAVKRNAQTVSDRSITNKRQPQAWGQPLTLTSSIFSLSSLSLSLT